MLGGLCQNRSILTSFLLDVFKLAVVGVAKIFKVNNLKGLFLTNRQIPHSHQSLNMFKSCLA